MTGEQIRQNAEECASKIYGYPYTEEISCKQHYIDGYITGVHSRDEEIEQLGKDYHDMFLTLANKIEQLRKPWTNVVERLPEEGQDVLICNWAGRITRNDYISKGDINYMKEHPEVYTSWMLIPKPGLN